MSWRHPSRKRLQAWFEGDACDSSLDAHLDTCERCTAVIEELAVGSDPLQSALQQVLAPPADIRQRLEIGINTRLQNRQDLAVVAELMGIGLRTARLMVTDAPVEQANPAEENGQ
jgi:hypothetical protein